MKRKRKRLLEKKEILHQHRGEDGTVLGQAHPLNSIHKNTTTKEAHERTVKIDEKIKL
jgi:hypothetical protein